MSWWTTIPSSDVLVEDIGDTLNYYGGSVTVNQPHTYFTTAANINKWAKYKPIIFAADDITESDRKKMSYGISDIPYWTNIPDMVADFYWGKSVAPANMSHMDEYWNYTLPAGGSSQPLRLGDFCGYYGLAEGPVGKPNATSYTLSTSNVLTMNFSYHNSSAGEISLSDVTLLSNGSSEFAKFEDMYLGVCFVLSDSLSYFITQTATIGSMGSNAVNFNISGADVLLGSSVGVFAFANVEPISSLVSKDPSTRGGCAPIPSSKSTISIVSGTPTVTLTITINSATQVATRSMNVSVTFKNETSYAQSLTNVTVYALDSSYNVVSTTACDNISLSSQSSYSITYQAAMTGTCVYAQVTAQTNSGVYGSDYYKITLI